MPETVKVDTESIPPKQPHVFFVDDDPATRKTLDRTVRQQGIKVTCFDHGADCLDSLTETRCDLLITDLKIPEMNGLELLTRAKAIYPWLPVLIVTGYGDVPTAVQAMNCGAADIIEKPLDRDTIVEVTKSLLSQTLQFSELIGKPLTKTETLILHHVMEGKSSKEIARIFHRSLRTVEIHRQRIMEKFGVNNVVQLARAVSDMGVGF